MIGSVPEFCTLAHFSVHRTPATQNIFSWSLQVPFNESPLYIACLLCKRKKKYMRKPYARWPFPGLELFEVAFSRKQKKAFGIIQSTVHLLWQYKYEPKNKAINLDINLSYNEVASSNFGEGGGRGGGIAC